MPENNNYTLSKTKEWFEKAVPNPELKNFNAQLGVHFEEIAEMLGCLWSKDNVQEDLMLEAHRVMQKLAERTKANSSKNTIAFAGGAAELDFLDSLCDQIVTATGVAHMKGYDIIGAMNEVNRSNFSKFVDGKPVFNTNSKIIKGKDYSEPDLKPFLKV